MKKLCSMICLITICLSIVGCSQMGKSNKAIITIRESKQFSVKEINEAMDRVKNKFKDFKGCELKTLLYDEDKSNSFIQGYINNGNDSGNGVSAENMIVLLSDFYVDSSGAEGSFNPDSTYYAWNWILVRDNKTSPWKVEDWGY